jgi:hypothetical protein
VVEIDMLDYTNQPPASSDLKTIVAAQAKRVKHPPTRPGLSTRARLLHCCYPRAAA